MTFSPTPFLVRLQELKLWQGNYDSLLQNKNKEQNCGGMDETTQSNASDSNKTITDWDRKVVSPSKPFEQLLEEKLAEYQPTNTEPKPKKPYLKKGQGLARFKLKSAPISNKPSATSKKSVTKAKSIDGALKKREQNEVILPARKLDPKMLSPLKIPEGMIQPKGVWLDASKGDQENLISNLKMSPKKLENDREQLRRYANSFNSEIINKIQEFGELHHFFPKQSEMVASTENLSVKTSNEPGEQTLYEQQLEKELRIFEILEKKVENSSFSSTNTSVMNLLTSSTPSKNKKILISDAIEEEKLANSEGKSRDCLAEKKSNCLNLQEKFFEVNKKTDLLRNFLVNLKKASGRRRNSACSDTEMSDFTPLLSLNTSFSDEEKWSSNATSPIKSQSISSYCTDNTLPSNYERSVKKVETAVNTSIDNSATNDEKCENCGSLEQKLKQLSRNMPDVQAEKAKVMDFVRDLEKKRDELNKEMRNMKKNHEEEMYRLKDQFDMERKRFTREKVYFETYIKDSQNRPTRKDREEILNLKKELADIKELVKLKETKNGATQCRLRNHIKALEKENGELKNEVEKLQKENAKLMASQKVNRRPSDSKMLQEINKNLSKLAEETFKKQASKSGDESDTKSKEKGKKNKTDSRKTFEKLCKENVEPENAIIQKATRNRENSISNDSNNFEIANISIEKQYESVFGQFESPRPNASSSNTNNEKTETIFEDGSMLIKYSNGNEKTVSPDGTIVRIKYFNGDIKETNTKEKTIRYFYLENSTWHMQLEDGSEIIEHPDGQRSKRSKDGKIEVTYPDGTYRIINSDGSEEAQHPDGSKTVKKADGEVVIHLPNGQREIHTKDHKRREYPDGTVRILYEDGKIETRYSTGRIRIKDANNVLILDTHEKLP